MEQRKLIKLGNSSFAIALPKDWVEKSGLKKGDNIFVERSPNGEVIISSQFRRINGDKIKTLDFSGIVSDKQIRREISTAYVQDYSRFEIKGIKDAKERQKIKEYINYLMGLEVIDDTKESLVVKDFFDLSEVNIENFVRRIDNNIRSMLDEVQKGISAGKLTQKQFDEIYEADHDINKFYLLINKILIKGMSNPSVLNMLKIDMNTLFNNWWVAYNLEQLGDELKRTARFLKHKIPDDKLKEINKTFISLRDLYSISITSYYKKDRTLSLDAIGRKDELHNQANLLSDDEDSTTAKIGEKLKGINGTIHQVNKIILYSLLPEV